MVAKAFSNSNLVRSLSKETQAVLKVKLKWSGVIAARTHMGVFLTENFAFALILPILECRLMHILWQCAPQAKGDWLLRPDWFSEGKPAWVSHGRLGKSRQILPRILLYQPDGAVYIDRTDPYLFRLWQVLFEGWIAVTYYQ
jgi:hypothetical protein